MELELTDHRSPGGVSRDSPLGSALFGKQVGDQVVVKAPRSSWTATVLEVTGRDSAEKN